MVSTLAQFALGVCTVSVQHQALMIEKSVSALELFRELTQRLCAGYQTPTYPDFREFCFQ
jgi:hypothetical protein